MAKGNFTKGTEQPRDVSKVKEHNDVYVAELNSYKVMAEKRRALRAIKQEDAHIILGKMLNYIETNKSEGKPLTISGLNLSTGLTSKVFGCARRGEYDHYLEEFMGLNGYTDDDIEIVDGLPFIDGTLAVPYSEIMDYAVLMIQEQREIACSSLRGNPAGNIFLLKAQNGLREEESPQTVNQTLVIADSNKALEAMKLLGD